MLTVEHFRSVVHAAVLAPSADNRHPLLFEQAGERVRVWGNDEFRAAPFHRRVLFLIAIGAVVENMRLRARSLGLETEVGWSPDPREPWLVAELRVLRSGAAPDALADAIPERHTNRRLRYRGPALTPAQRGQLEDDCAAVAGARIVWLDQRELRRRALRLVRIAERERFRCRPLHHELFSGIRFDAGWNQATDEGLAPGSLGVERPLRWAFKALRHWGLMRMLTYVGGHHLLGLRAGDLPCRMSPHLGAIATSLALEQGARAVGQAFERVWLRATSLGAALQPFAASTLFALDGYEDVRGRLRRELAQGWASVIPGLQPLIVFRIGRAPPPAARSGRRGLDSYLKGGS
jgi:hypothetical protein